MGSLIPDRFTFYRHKRRVTEYLLSHVASCALPTVKLFLVALLEHVPDRAKAEALSPIVQALTDKVKVPEWERLFGPQLEEFATITISAFDATAAAVFSDSNGIFWPVFLNAIEFYFQPGEHRIFRTLVLLVLISTFVPGSLPLPREALSNNLKNGLFTRLSQDRQRELCRSIITIGAGSSDAVRHFLSRSRARWRVHIPIQKPYCIALLAQLLSGAPLLIQLMTDLRPIPIDAPNRATKRTKIIE